MFVQHKCHNVIENYLFYCPLFYFCSALKYLDFKIIGKGNIIFFDDQITESAFSKQTGIVCLLKNHEQHKQKVEKINGMEFKKWFKNLFSLAITIMVSSIVSWNSRYVDLGELKNNPSLRVQIINKLIS